MDLEPADLDKNEVLLAALFEATWESDPNGCHAFQTSMAGRQVKLIGSHIERSEGGGIMGMMLGVQSQVAKDYWYFTVQIADKQGQPTYKGCITFKTGMYTPVIDGLLEDLYIYVESCHHNQTVGTILEELGSDKIH